MSEVWHTLIIVSTIDKIVEQASNWHTHHPPKGVIWLIFSWCAIYVIDWIRFWCIIWLKVMIEYLGIYRKRYQNIEPFLELRFNIIWYKLICILFRVSHSCLSNLPLEKLFMRSKAASEMAKRWREKRRPVKCTDTIIRFIRCGALKYLAIKV